MLGYYQPRDSNVHGGPSAICLPFSQGSSSRFKAVPSCANVNRSLSFQAEFVLPNMHFSNTAFPRGPLRRQLTGTTYSAASSSRATLCEYRCPRQAGWRAHALPPSTKTPAMSKGSAGPVTVSTPTSPRPDSTSQSSYDYAVQDSRTFRQTS